MGLINYNMAQVSSFSIPPNLEVGNELDRGAWGVVYNGDLDGRPVAVKRIHDLLLQGTEEERRKVFGDFREECKRLQNLNHPHIVGRCCSEVD